MNVPLGRITLEASPICATPLGGAIDVQVFVAGL
jgi:hypothetical protein